MEQELCIVCQRLSSLREYDLEKWKRYIDNEEGSMELLRHSLLENLQENSLDRFTEILFWLLNNKEALEQFTCSGAVENNRWTEAIETLSQIIDKNERPPSGYHLQVAIATALTFSTPVTSLAYQYLAKDDPDKAVFISGVERFQSFCTWVDQGDLFPEFLDLSTWHMRYVVGSWATDQELIWARENVLPEFKHVEKVGEATHKMVKYRKKNDKGISVYNPKEFYEGRPQTMEVFHEYGAVCGGVAKFGCAMSQAFGLPAMPFTQPEHCAFVWLEKGRFQLSNDQSGWLKSGKHDGIQNTWGGDEEKDGGVWMLPIMEKAQEDFVKYCLSEKFRIASGLIGEKCDGDEGEKACALLREATMACWANVTAWKERVDMELKTTNEKVKWQHKDWMLTAGKWLHENRGGVISYRKKVEVSDNEKSAGNIVDGTRSEWLTGEKSAWVEIDLGEAYGVEVVKIEWWADHSMDCKYSIWAALDKGDFLLKRSKLDEIKSGKGWSEVTGWPEETKHLRLELEDGKLDPWNLGKYFGIRQILVLGHPSRKSRVISYRKKVEVSDNAKSAGNIVDGTRSEWLSEEKSAWVEIDLGESYVVEGVKIEWWADHSKDCKYSIWAALGKGDYLSKKSKSDEIKSEKGWSEVMGWPEETKHLRLELEDGKLDPWNLGKYYGIRQILVLGYASKKSGILNLNMQKVDGLAISTDGYWCSNEEEAWIEFHLDSVCTVETVQLKGEGGKCRVSTDLSPASTDWRGSGPQDWIILTKEFTEVVLDVAANKVRVEFLCNGNGEEMMKLEDIEVVGVSRNVRELMKANVEKEMGGDETFLSTKGEAEKASLIRYVHGLLDRNAAE